jgi:hypothetical protein
MSKEYNQQDGGPATQPDSGEVTQNVTDERPATVGERSTQPSMAGQGTGQISGADAEREAPASRTGEEEV